MAYVAGQWNAVCDRCGFSFKARQLHREWTGLRVCKGPGTNDCWEPRHPQDLIQGKKDRQAPPWVRPNAAEPVFLLDENGEILLDENGFPLLDETSPDNTVEPGSGREVTPDDL